MKYIVVVYLKGKRCSECYDLRAINLVEAMTESEHFLTDDVYLIRIAERVGRIERREGNKISKFCEILCNRWKGWHPCDNAHSETSATWTRYESIKHPEMISYEISYI